MTALTYFSAMKKPLAYAGRSSSNRKKPPDIIIIRISSAGSAEVQRLPSTHQTCMILLLFVGKDNNELSHEGVVCACVDRKCNSISGQTLRISII